MTPAASPPCPQTWLVVRLGAMGDVMLTSGVMKHWHERLGLRFRVLTKVPWAGLLENHPAVDALIPLEQEQLQLRPFLALARELARKSKGQGLLDLHDTPRSRLLALLWQGPVKRYDKSSLLRRIYARWRLPALRQRLEDLNVTQRYALALEAIAPPAGELVPRIWLRQAELEQAREALSPLGLGQRPLVALHPFAAHEAKTWPVAHWHALLGKLHAAGCMAFFIGMGRLPASLKDMVRAGEAVSFVNAATPRQSAALLALSQALVTGDSGPMHLGIAAGAPTVALFGPTARVWGFYPEPPHRVLEVDLPCRPCSLHGGRSCPLETGCMASIPPQRVLEALQPFISVKQDAIEEHGAQTEAS